MSSATPAHLIGRRAIGGKHKWRHKRGAPAAGHPPTPAIDRRRPGAARTQLARRAAAQRPAKYLQMLAVTENAVLAIRELVAASPLSDHAGIRIATAAGEGRSAFQLSLAEAPAPGDRVLGESDAPVYLSPQAAPFPDTYYLGKLAAPDTIDTVSSRRGRLPP